MTLDLNLNLNVEAWLAIGFFILVAFAWKPAKKALNAILEEHAESIKQQLDESEKQVEKATSALQKAKELLDQQISEANELLENAPAEAARLRPQFIVEFEKHAHKRETAFLHKIEQRRIVKQEQIRNAVYKLSYKVATEYITKHYANQSLYFDEALESLEEINFIEA